MVVVFEECASLYMTYELKGSSSRSLRSVFVGGGSSMVHSPFDTCTRKVNFSIDSLRSSSLQLLWISYGLCGDIGGPKKAATNCSAGLRPGNSRISVASFVIIPGPSAISPFKAK